MGHRTARSIFVEAARRTTGPKRAILASFASTSLPKNQAQNPKQRCQHSSRRGGGCMMG